MFNRISIKRMELNWRIKNEQGRKASSEPSGHWTCGSRKIHNNGPSTISGQTGKVKEIRLMHLVLDTGEEEILIPSGTVITQIFRKKKSLNTRK